jgi:hypothetical protein
MRYGATLWYIAYSHFVTGLELSCDRDKDHQR